MRRSALLRSTPLCRTALARKAPPGRRVGVRRRNSKRADQARREQFGDRDRVAAIRRMPCVCKGRHPECSGGWSDPSHITSRGAGGKAEDIVPMSHGCHLAWHRGRLTYLRAIGMDLDGMRAEAARVAAELTGLGDSDA